MAFLTSQLHNFAIELGYTLDKGVTLLVGEIVENNKDRFRNFDVPIETYDSYKSVINVSKTWIKQSYGVREYEVLHYEKIIQNFARVMIYYACIVANANARKQVKACDIALLKSFLEAIWAFEII